MPLFARKQSSKRFASTVRLLPIGLMSSERGSGALSRDKVLALLDGAARTRGGILDDGVGPALARDVPSKVPPAPSSSEGAIP